MTFLFSFYYNTVIHTLGRADLLFVCCQCVTELAGSETVRQSNHWDYRTWQVSITTTSCITRVMNEICWENIALTDCVLSTTDVTIMTSSSWKFLQNVPNEIPYISDFSYFENWQNYFILLIIYDTTLVVSQSSHQLVTQWWTCTWQTSIWILPTTLW